MIASSRPWADGPYELITTPGQRFGVNNQATYTANMMAQNHNIYLRSLNAIHHQCTGITSPTDIADFLFYCRTWCKHVQGHHDTEEDTFFPAIERVTGVTGMMDVDKEQHAAFHDSFSKFTTYVTETSVKGYDGRELRRLVDAVGEPLTKHLHDEIEHLIAVGNEHDPDGSKLKKLWDEISLQYRKKSSPHSDAPFIFSARDVTYESGIQDWPHGVPFFVPYLIHYVFARRGEHRGAWRFAPSDTWGRPKRLAFSERTEM